MGARSGAAGCGHAHSVLRDTATGPTARKSSPVAAPLSSRGFPERTAAAMGCERSKTLVVVSHQRSNLSHTGVPRVGRSRLRSELAAVGRSHSLRAWPTRPRRGWVRATAGSWTAMCDTPGWIVDNLLQNKWNVDRAEPPASQNWPKHKCRQSIDLLARAILQEHRPAPLSRPMPLVLCKVPKGSRTASGSQHPVRIVHAARIRLADLHLLVGSLHGRRD
eukprot:366361-Chlamydomonas_euryale.AAC.2